MKKLGLIVTAALLLLSTEAYSQEKRVTLGVKAGANVTRFVGSYSFMHSAYRPGLNAGLTLDVRLSRQFSLMTGVEYSQKGSKQDVIVIDDNFKLYNGTQFHRANYLQIPVHIAIGNKIPGSKNTRAYFRTGLYFAAGIDGKTTLTAGGKKYEADTFGSNMLKRFDCGLGVGVGVDIGHIALSVGCDIGFINLPAGAHPAKLRNFSYSSSLGYKF